MNPQSFNPYVYCLNNPLKYIDPSGERPMDWPDEIPYRGPSEDYSEEIEEWAEKEMKKASGGARDKPYIGKIPPNTSPPILIEYNQQSSKKKWHDFLMNFPDKFVQMFGTESVTWVLAEEKDIKLDMPLISRDAWLYMNETTPEGVMLRKGAEVGGMFVAPEVAVPIFLWDTYYDIVHSFLGDDE